MWIEKKIIMLPPIHFKEDLNEFAKKVWGATVMPQNHRQPVNTRQCDFHRERLQMPAAKLGGVTDSSANPAESSNQSGTHDMHQGQSIENRRAPSLAPFPEPTTLGSDLLPLAFIGCS